MGLNCGVGEDSWESLGLQGDPTSPFWRRSVLGIHWKDWCWSWNSNTLATWCKELTYLKRRWCWERLEVGGEGDDRGWDCWMASPTQWTWVSVNSGSWWWTGRPGMLHSMGSQIARHYWATELNWLRQKILVKTFLIQNFIWRTLWNCTLYCLHSEPQDNKQNRNKMIHQDPPKLALQSTRKITHKKTTCWQPLLQYLWEAFGR